jgi:heme oxygenase-like protein
MSAVPGASARLSQKLELVRPAVETPGRLLLESPRARELYPTYLASGSYVALVMVPLMEHALVRSRALMAVDPVAARLANYLERHIPEEMHGDQPGAELIEDLGALGVDVEALRAQPLPEKIAALIGTLYFRIFHSHPVAILGLLWLEVYPPQAPIVELLMERTGLSRDGFRQLLLHSEVDTRHGQELKDVLDSLPLEPWHEELIGLSALQTIAFLVDAWMEVLGTDVEAPAAAAR